jgi:hypothetical protein
MRSHALLKFPAITLEVAGFQLGQVFAWRDSMLVCTPAIAMAIKPNHNTGRTICRMIIEIGRRVYFVW